MHRDIEKLVDEIPEIVCSKDIAKLLGVSEGYATNIACEMLPKSHGRVGRNKFWVKDNIRSLLISLARSREKKLTQKTSTGCEILCQTLLSNELGISTEHLAFQVKRGKIPPPNKCCAGKYWLRKDLIAAKVLEH